MSSTFLFEFWPFFVIVQSVQCVVCVRSPNAEVFQLSLLFRVFSSYFFVTFDDAGSGQVADAGVYWCGAAVYSEQGSMRRTLVTALQRCVLW